MTFVNSQIKRYKLDYFFEEMSNYGELQIFGGFARDLYLEMQYPIRDIDIVFEPAKGVKLFHILKKFTDNIKINKFKGYKIIINGIKIDIWSIEDTWAFKENILDITSSGLEETTYLAIDSIYYSYNKQIWNSENFDKVIEKKELDVILLKNPNKELNLTKNLAQKKKYEKIFDYEFSFSNQLKDEYLEYFEGNGITGIYEKQLSRYNQEFYSKKELYNMISNFRE